MAIVDLNNAETLRLEDASLHEAGSKRPQPPSKGTYTIYTSIHLQNLTVNPLAELNLIWSHDFNCFYSKMHFRCQLKNSSE